MASIRTPLVMLALAPLLVLVLSQAASFDAGGADPIAGMRLPKVGGGMLTPAALHDGYNCLITVKPAGDWLADRLGPVLAAGSEELAFARVRLVTVVEGSLEEATRFQVDRNWPGVIAADEERRFGEWLLGGPRMRSVRFLEEDRTSRRLYLIDRADGPSQHWSPVGELVSGLMTCVAECADGAFRRFPIAADDGGGELLLEDRGLELNVLLSRSAAPGESQPALLRILSRDGEVLGSATGQVGRPCRIEIGASSPVWMCWQVGEREERRIRFDEVGERARFLGEVRGKIDELDLRASFFDDEGTPRVHIQLRNGGNADRYWRRWPGGCSSFGGWIAFEGDEFDPAWPVPFGVGCSMEKPDRPPTPWEIAGWRFPVGAVRRFAVDFSPSKFELLAPSHELPEGRRMVAFKFVVDLCQAIDEPLRRLPSAWPDYTFQFHWVEGGRPILDCGQFVEDPR